MGIIVTMYFSCYIFSPDEAIRKWFFHQAQLEREQTEGPGERTEAKTLVPSKVLGPLKQACKLRTSRRPQKLVANMSIPITDPWDGKVYLLTYMNG